MYKLLCFAPDGSYVTEGEFDEIAEANRRDNDLGSRWIFYPIHVIAKDGEIVMGPIDYFDGAAGQTVQHFGKFLADNEAEIVELLNA